MEALGGSSARSGSWVPATMAGGVNWGSITKPAHGALGSKSEDRIYLSTYKSLSLCIFLCFSNKQMNHGKNIIFQLISLALEISGLLM